MSMARQVFVINAKGGCGKTTIATELAGYFSQTFKTALIDHDVQKSSTDWLHSRPSTCPRIKLLAQGAPGKHDYFGFDWVVHDTPANYCLDVFEHMVSDNSLVVIPVLPSPIDIKSCLRLIMQLQRLDVVERNIRLCVVANRVRTNTNYYKILIEFLERLDAPLVGQIKDSQNYVRVMAAGISIFDLPPSKVKSELAQWSVLCHWLNQ